MAEKVIIQKVTMNLIQKTKAIEGIRADGAYKKITNLYIAQITKIFETKCFEKFTKISNVKQNFTVIWMDGQCFKDTIS